MAEKTAGDVERWRELLGGFRYRYESLTICRRISIKGYTGKDENPFWVGGVTMSDYVLSVWGRGDAEGEPHPIRLSKIGSDNLLASHWEGFDLTPLANVDLKSVFSMTSLGNAGVLEFVGETLWRRLTPGNIGAELSRVYRDSRIYLDLHGRNLSDYPWELLREGGDYVFAVRTSHWSLGSPQRKPNARQPIDLDHPLRVMVVLGNDPADRRLRGEDELEHIERQAHLKNSDVFLRVLHRPNPAEMDAELHKFKPHVFHFIGHGAFFEGKPVIYTWAGDVGIQERWDVERIRGIFDEDPPRLVVLNACLTATADDKADAVTGKVSSDRTRPIAEAFLDAGCLSVVAMQGEIRGDASVEFSNQFYAFLFEGKSVDEAVTRSRNALKNTVSASSQAEDIQALRSNWPLVRHLVRGDASKAIKMPEGKPKKKWLRDDFVDRWSHRWLAWDLFNVRSRLAVLYGGIQAGKTELLENHRRSLGAHGPTGAFPESRSPRRFGHVARPVDANCPGSDKNRPARSGESSGQSGG